MNREFALAIAAVVVAIAALATLALSGAVSDPAEPETGAEVETEGHASLLEVTIAADEIAGETAHLEVDTYLEHHGDPVENVTVVHRATDTDTSLVEDTTEREVGTLEGEREVVVPATIDIPREGTHRIETFVYVDGTRTQSNSYRVSGVDTLTPAYAETGLEFHRFGGDYGGDLADVPALEYSIESTTDETATLEVTSYLTNAGDDVADSVEVEVKARQAESNIVADSETVGVSNVDPGETATPTVELEVADEYGYYLDAILWLDGTIVATDRAVADLDPDTSAENATLETADFEESDDEFQTVEENGADEGTGYSEDAHENGADSEDGDEASADGTPGFGLGAGIAALALLSIGAGLTRARTRRENP